MTAHTVAFGILGALAVGTAILTVTRRHPVAAALFLILHLLSLAGLYALLDAHFVAVLQVLVYAGAIVVLFLFVILLLNLREEELGASQPDAAKGFAVVLGIVGYAFCAWRVGGEMVGAEFSDVSQDVKFGHTATLAREVFGNSLLAFELTSLLLLVGMIAVLLLATRRTADPAEAEDGS